MKILTDATIFLCENTDGGIFFATRLYRSINLGARFYLRQSVGSTDYSTIAGS